MHQHPFLCPNGGGRASHGCREYLNPSNVFTPLTTRCPMLSNKPNSPLPSGIKRGAMHMHMAHG
jgi:hypothetical protein